MLILNWNKCCLKAVGDYLILASDDDVYSPDFLDEVSCLLERFPKVSLVPGRVRSINEEGAEVEKDHLFPIYMYKPNKTKNKKKKKKKKDL